VPGGSGGTRVNVPRTAGGLLQRVGEALDQAIHGGDGGANAQAVRAGGSLRGLNPVPFPMVNPFKPVVKTRSPVTGLTAFPSRFTYKVPAGNDEPDDEQNTFEGFSGLGYSWADMLRPGDLLPSSPTKLQTVLGTIQATLPATIQAIRAQPSNIFPGTSYNPYTTNYPGAVYPGAAGADIGASAGAAVGNVGDTIGGIVARHPYLVLGGVAAAVLLFMNPPRRR